MTTTIPIKIISIGGDGFHLLMKIHINRKVANMIVDTGASKTVFDQKKIKKYVTEKKFDTHDNLSIGLGSNKIKSKLTTLKTIKIGDLKIKNYDTVLLDLTHVNQSYEQLGIKQIDGILGSDLLEEYKGVINFHKKTVKLTFRVSAK